MKQNQPGSEPSPTDETDTTMTDAGEKKTLISTNSCNRRMTANRRWRRMTRTSRVSVTLASQASGRCG